MDRSGNLTEMDFRTVKLICSALENVVKRSLGPLGLQTLLSTDTGHLVVTNDGLTMIEALHLSHPVAKLITQSLSKAINYTEDGSKTFILWLAKSVSDIEEEISLNSTQSGSTENTCRIQMSKNLQKILPGLLKGVVEYVWDHSTMRTCTKHLDQAILNKRVIHSVIRPHFPQNISNIFTELLCTMTQFDSSRDFRRCLEYLIDNLELLCIKVVSQPYTSSSLLESFLIQRDFMVYCPHGLNGNVKFVLVRCVMGQLNKEKKNNEKIKLTTSQQIYQYLQNQKKSIENFITVCQSNAVTLVLSTEKIPDFALTLFQASDISVVHFVSEEEAEFLQTSLKLQPIANIFDAVEANNIGLATQCSLLVISGRRCVHLGLPKLPHMLLVCGLSDKLCKQVMLACSKALKVLLHYHRTENLMSIVAQGEITNQVTQGEIISKIPESLKEINNFFPKDIAKMDYQHQSDSLMETTTNGLKLCICRNSVSGSSFEFMAAKYCQERAKELRVADSELSTLCGIISKALLTVPQCLHENSCGSQRDKINFIAKQQHVFSVLEGIGKRETDVDTLSLLKYCHGSDDCVEPLSSKLHLLSTLIELLIQLLRIDSVIGVKSIHV